MTLGWLSSFSDGRYRQSGTCLDQGTVVTAAESLQVIYFCLNFNRRSGESNVIKKYLIRLQVTITGSSRTPIIRDVVSRKMEFVGFTELIPRVD